MKRILIAGLLLGLATSSIAAATRNWLASPELHSAVVPRDRHGKSIRKAKRAAYKQRHRRTRHGRCR
ncbi:MAG TPA: hypothetical protein VGC62_04560 [Pseudomonas sp.]|uniref:hypothetical protein n=1 Tax=Pseudomonas sp. TaxID=306 RepID=UPI002ED77A94